MRAEADTICALDRRGCRFDPSGAMLRIERGGEPTGGLFCLRERADAAIAQLRKQGDENARRGHGIGGRGVTALDRDVQPCGKLVEREAGEIWLDQLSEQPRVERARRASRRCPERRHSFSNIARSKPIVCPITTVPAKQLSEFRPDLPEVRSTLQDEVVDPMDARSLGRNGFSRINEPPQRLPGIDLPADDPHGGHFDDPRLARIEPCGLGIEDNRIEGDQRRRVQHGSHARPFWHNENPRLPGLPFLAEAMDKPTRYMVT